MESKNYKRTLAGSVGAGMGALFNGSGRTYYIIEHKTSTKYHQAGESQKIIIDQAELGRAGSCQIRFDESCETVSRRHAAIVRDGQNWKLIHLGSNPTLINGRPISGSYYLQSGDEIQLSVGGPRMGFIVPQGRQALTSSIGMTERMNLFRQQALRPYKTALITMAVLFALAVSGLGYWNYTLGQENNELRSQLDTQMARLETLSSKADSLANLDKELNAQLETASPEEAQQIRDRIVVVRRQMSSVASQMGSVASNAMGIAKASKEAIGGVDDELREEMVSKAEEAQKKENEIKVIVSKSITIDKAAAVPNGASFSLEDYHKHIYSLKVDRIDVEYNGQAIDHGIGLSSIVCGTGFMRNDGTFVTDRQNVEPWLYSGGWKESWRHELAQYKAIGCDIIIHYKAYSQRGTGRSLSFTNSEFLVDRSGDVQQTIEITKTTRHWISVYGIVVPWVQKNKTVNTSVYTPKSLSYAEIHLGGAGIPCNSKAAMNLKGGDEIKMVGFIGNTNIHNLVPQTFNGHVQQAAGSGTINLQTSTNNRGYYGSPAFAKTENGYECIGIYTGAVGGQDRLVPAYNIQ